MLENLYNILLPFFVSLLIAYILDPIVGWFQTKCRIRSRVLAVMLTLLSVILVVTGLISTMMPTINSQVRQAKAGFEAYVAKFDINKYLTDEQQERLNTMTAEWNIESIIASPEVQSAVKNIVPKIGDWITGGLSWLSGLMVIFIGLMYLIFLMIDFPNMRASWQKYVPARYKTQIVTLMQDLDRNMNAYFRGQAMVALCVGVLFAIGFTIIGLPMGIAMGLIVGMLNLVPYMQALGIPPCIILSLIQAAQSDRPVWLCLLLLAVVFIVVQTIQDMILTPRIMGNATGLSPASILLSLSIWGALLGVIGMIIALPFTSLIISYYQHYIAKPAARGAIGDYRGRIRKEKKE